MVTLEELATTLPRGAALLGLDVGAKTVGLALSDRALIVATPFTTLRRGKFAADAERLGAIVAEHGVGGLVVGLPVNMDGSEGPACQSVRQFAANLEAAFEVDIAIAFWDERLSTAAVERTLIEADVSRKRRRQVIDKMAAAYILQGALDRLAAARR